MKMYNRISRVVKAGHYTRVKLAGVYVYIANENRKTEMFVSISIHPQVEKTKRLPLMLVPPGARRKS